MTRSKIWIEASRFQVVPILAGVTLTRFSYSHIDLHLANSFQFLFFQGIFTNPIFCVIWITTFIAHIIIIQFGGAWFSTHPLTLQQWIVCLVLGFSTLIWGQIVATIPSKKLPKAWKVGKGDVQPAKLHINGDYNVRARSRALTLRRSGKSLWMRGMFIIGNHVSSIIIESEQFIQLTFFSSAFSVPSEWKRAKRPLSDVPPQQ